MFEKNELKKQTKSFSPFNKKLTSSYKSAGSSHSSNLSDSSYFLQRYLGNSYMQSSGYVPIIQKKCDCGGTCTSCSEEEEIMGIEAKLKIGEPDDVYEREADRVAERVMRMPDSSLESGDERPNVGIKPRRMSSAESRFRESTTDIRLNQSGGHRFSESTLEFMEPRFGVDFSDVRLHSDSDAHQTASRINARAFTYGSHIWMGQGESEQNRKLMAHELTHVVQQGSVEDFPSGRGARITDSRTDGRPIRRVPGDEGPAGEGGVAPLTLSHPRFAGDRILERILTGDIAALSSRYDGRRGPVSKVQQALVDLGFELPMHRVDGSYGDETEEAIGQFRIRYGPSAGSTMDGAALGVLDRVAPAPGERHEHTVDYDRLLADRRLDVTVGIGATDTTVVRQTGPRTYEQTERPTEDLMAERFRVWMERNGFDLELLGWSGNEYWKATRTITWTGADGTEHTHTVEIWINFVVPTAGAAREFREGLSRDEITIYTGHARYGSGPDFDVKASPVENFRIGIDNALRAAGRRTSVDEARHHGVAVDEENDLLEMVHSGSWDPDRYRVLFFNACTSLAYLDEIREHVGGPENVDVVATRRPSAFSRLESEAGMEEVQRFLEGIINAESVESVITALNELQRVRYGGRGFPRGGVFTSSGLGGNPRLP